LKILADEGVFVPKEISIGSGERSVAIIMKSSDLKDALGSVDLSKFTSE
jgi:hypothetical protein